MRKGQHFAFFAGMLAVAASATANFGYFAERDLTFAVAAAVAGSFLFGFVAEDVLRRGKLEMAFCVAIAAATAYFESARIGSCALVAGVVLKAATPTTGGTARIAGGFVLGGLALLFASAFLFVWEKIELVRPGCAAIAFLTALPARFVGQDVFVDGGRVLLDSGHGSLAVAVDYWKIGGTLSAVMLVLPWFFRIFASNSSTSLRSLVGHSALLLLYVVVRLWILIVLVAYTTPDLTFAVDPTYILLSFLPYPLVAMLLTRGENVATGPTKSRPIGDGLAIAGVVVAAAVGAFSSSWFGSGEKSGSRILWDDSHSEWERTDRPFDRNFYGKASTYNYAALVDLLGRQYDLRQKKEGEITPDDLREIDVFVMKTPTKPYAPSEVSAILDFVRRGGGLWLVGDHTNLHGMGEILNVFAEPAGFRFNYDTTYDAVTGGITYNRNVGTVHPITRDSDGLMYQSSCSIEPLSMRVVPVMIGRRMTAEYADYGHVNFFGNIRTDLEDRSGTFIQCAASTYGRGRVVGFSDSTIFSNFEIFDTGVSELAVRSVGFLAHPATIVDRHRSALLFFAGLLGAASMWRLGLRNRAVSPIVPQAMILAGFSVAALCAEATMDSIDVPESRRPYRQVSMLSTTGGFNMTMFLEEAQGSQEVVRDPTSVGTFFTWIMRLDGVRPRRDATIADAVAAGSEVIVAFYPRRSPTHDELRQINLFVARGGKLLVVDDIGNSAVSKAKDWVAPFRLVPRVEESMKTVHDPRAVRSLELTRKFPVIAAVEALGDLVNIGRARPGEKFGRSLVRTRMVADGGHPLIVDESGATIAAHARFGLGAAVLFTNGHSLTNRALGGRYDSQPDEDMLGRYDAALDLLTRVLALPAAEGRESP